jgi:hypothetical protein
MAVIGVSLTNDRHPANIIYNKIHLRYPVKVFPVNPRGGSLSGGTGVEIYRDMVLRMAPLKPTDIESMIKGLKAHQLLEGYRGAEPVNLQARRILQMIPGSEFCNVFSMSAVIRIWGGALPLSKITVSNWPSIWFME